MGENPQRLGHRPAAERLLLTTEEAADLLGVGRTTVYALMKAGELRPVHIGRSCRISHAELKRYVSRLEAPPPSPPIRRRRQQRTSTDQRELFQLNADAVDKH